METLLFRCTVQAGLHVIQRAAAPARKPRPIRMHIIAGAVIPACVKESSVATTRLSAVPLLFRATSTLFVRLTARFFVSHNYVSWSICFLFRLSTHPCGGRTFICGKPARGRQALRCGRAGVLLRFLA